MSSTICECGKFTLASFDLCIDCFEEQEKIKTQKLKVFEVDLQPDYQIDKQGFYLMVLAKDLDQAKVFAQTQFNIEYEGVINVYQDDVQFSEIEGPFPAGKVLVSLHY